MIGIMLKDIMFRSENIVLELEVPLEQAIQNLGSSVGASTSSSNSKEDAMVGGVSQMKRQF